MGRELSAELIDDEYVERRSLALDLQILGRTLALLLTGHGLYG